MKGVQLETNIFQKSNKGWVQDRYKNLTGGPG